MWRADPPPPPEGAPRKAANTRVERGESEGLLTLDSDGDDFSGTLFPPAPEEAMELLGMAARSWDDTERALGYLLEADRRYGTHLPVVVGFYKFLFYKGRLREAIPIAKRAAGIMAVRIGLPARFEDVGVNDAPFSDYEAGPRFYLFAMKAVGYLHARLGETERGLEVLERVRALDRRDLLGVDRLIEVIHRGGREDE